MLASCVRAYYRKNLVIRDESMMNSTANLLSSWWSHQHVVISKMLYPSKRYHASFGSSNSFDTTAVIFSNDWDPRIQRSSYEALKGSTYDSVWPRYPSLDLPNKNLSYADWLSSILRSILLSDSETFSGVWKVTSRSTERYSIEY